MSVRLEWWPWWVTTLIALSVAAVALLALWRSRRPAVRSVAALLAVQGVVLAVVAPLVMEDMSATGSMMRTAAMSPLDSALSTEQQPADLGTLPFTFVFTRYEFPDETTVVYHEDGRVVAGAEDGSRIVLTGRGGWDPASRRAGGGGRFAVEDAGGKVVTRGAWRATRFISFLQLPGWLPPEIRERGRPPGSGSWSGVLKLAVSLDGGGRAVLEAWCVMSDEATKAARRRWDGMTLVGPGARFTNFRVNEDRIEGGVMFYGPAST